MFFAQDRVHLHHLHLQLVIMVLQMGLVKGFFALYPKFKKGRSWVRTRVRECPPVSAHPRQLLSDAWVTVLSGETVARGSHAGRWRTGTGLPGCCGLMAAMCVLGTGRSLRRLTACDVVVGTSCIMQRRWYDSGYMVRVISWVLVPCCTSFPREGELRS